MSKRGAYKKIEIPQIEAYKNQLYVRFGERVIAKDFVAYFGNIQQRILDDKEEAKICVDLSGTKYINQFCISKILLTLYMCRKTKIIKILLPSEENKMLRYLYNLGILDFIFSCPAIKCYINGNHVETYGAVYDFSDCYDHTIFPYTIFEYEIGEDNIKNEEEVISTCLQEIENYYCIEKKQPEKFKQFESRVHLYLQEIVDNIFRHAYRHTAIFAINVYNSYLPPYNVFSGTQEEKKFENRINRMQQEVPMSIYKDIQERYFGGFNIFIDDIGWGIQETYMGKNTENIYKDIYLNGSKKRQTINGLKLVADQISINNDILWAHDTRQWIRTSFIENNNICSSDDSKNNHYEHVPVKGLSYDLFINLAQNSMEKKRTYQRFGCKVEFDLPEIREIVSKDSISEDCAFVDILNIKNKNISMKPQLIKAKKILFYRPRAAQKNKMASELETRIISYFSQTSFFKYLIVYDLNQTTLFQARAVFEDEKIANRLIDHGIEKVILLTEECWLFAMSYKESAYELCKDVAETVEKELVLKDILQMIHYNDEQVLRELLIKNQNSFVIKADIDWGKQQIDEYIDIEKMILDRAVSDILCMSIARISGMLKSEKKVVFLENYMKTRFSVLVNEFKENAIQNIYLGSILMSGNTERRIAYSEEIKIYLYRHKKSKIQIDNNHIVLFELPQFTNKKSNRKYRRVLNTNRIELFKEESEEYSYYKSEQYKEKIKRIPFEIGFNDTGFLKIMDSELLLDLFTEFVVDVIEIKLQRHDDIRVELAEDMQNEYFRKRIEKAINELKKRNMFLGQTKNISLNSTESSNQLIIKLSRNIDLIDIISQANRSDTEITFISLFCNEQFNVAFYKIIDSGFMPFLPFFYSYSEPILNQAKLEKFQEFVQSLNPKYRREIENKYQLLSMNYNCKAEITAKFQHIEQLRDKSILVDLINYNVEDNVAHSIQGGADLGQYGLLINLLFLQHSMFRLNVQFQTQNVIEVFDFLTEVYSEIEDSVITFMLLVTISSIQLDYRNMEKFLDEKIAACLLTSRAVFVRIMFANFYNENSRTNYKQMLDEFFVRSDITIYYNMLAQLLFNSEHGKIHDSKIDKIYKKLDENMKNVSEDDINDIKSIIPNCISLLKMTKSYDKSMEEEEKLEKEFRRCCSDINNNLYDIEKIIVQLKTEGKKRFKIIEKEHIARDLEKYVSDIINVLQEKDYIIKEGEISKVNVTIGEDFQVDVNGRAQRSLKVYNDTIILEELAYLIHNAHKHSLCSFSIGGNYVKYHVWIKVELHDGIIVLRLINSIPGGAKQFQQIQEDIRTKRRIGKTYLEKFNITVIYYNNPKDILGNDPNINILETHIEIPYFN